MTDRHSIIQSLTRKNAIASETTHPSNKPQSNMCQRARELEASSQTKTGGGTGRDSGETAGAAAPPEPFEAGSGDGGEITIRLGGGTDRRPDATAAAASAPPLLRARDSELT